METQDLRTLHMEIILLELYEQWVAAGRPVRE